VSSQNSSEVAKKPVKFRRLLLKVGGESLCSQNDSGGGSGIEVEAAGRTADLIVSLHGLGVEIGLVLGGGNILRGGTLAGGGLERTTADAMGMLATVMNAMALADTIQARGVDARVLTAFPVGGFTELFSARGARRHLAAGRIVLMAGGTGNPFFTTDTNAALRAAEIGADILIKATKVDGVYSEDPMVNPDAIRYPTLTYRDVIERNLGVMDITAITLCMENRIPLVVCDLWQAGAVEAVLQGSTDTGTLIGR